MAKRKNKSTVTATEEVTTKPVVEEVKTDEISIDTSNTTDNTVIEDAEVITKKEEDTTKIDKKEPLPEVTPAPVKKEETKSGKQEINGSKADVQVELAKKYKVKFAQSYFMKTVAVAKEFSLFSIIETWMVNRTAFIGLVSLDDFNHIKDFLLNNTVTYKYKVIETEAKKQFIEKLEFNTQYIISHK